LGFEGPQAPDEVDLDVVLDRAMGPDAVLDRGRKLPGPVFGWPYQPPVPEPLSSDHVFCPI